MKRFITFTILLFVMTIFGIGNMFAQDYASMWEKVEKLSDDDKPKSVITQAEKIFDKAKKENNFAQMLKAKICITEKKCDLDPELFQPDEYEKLIKEVEDDKTLTADTKAARLSVLHCMLASAYCAMLDSYVHDFDEETREQFPEKTKAHCFAALSDMEILSHIDNKEYAPLVINREDGKFFNHDLLAVIIDFCTSDNYYNIKSGFSTEETLDILEKAIKVYEANGARDAATILRLRSLKEKYNTSIKALKIDRTTYFKCLEELHNQTQDIETGIDVDDEYSALMQGDEKLAFVRQAQIKWADNKNVNIFKRKEAVIMATHISIEFADNILANRPFNVNFKYENATSSTITIREYNGTDKNGKLHTNGKVLNKYTYNIILDENNQNRKNSNLPYEAQTTEQITLPAGHYVIVAETNGSKEARELKITSLRITSISLPDTKNMLVTVLDNETGRPVPGASIYCFDKWTSDFGEKPEKTFKVDENGEAIIPYYDEKGNRSYYRMMAVRNSSNYGTAYEDCTSSISTQTTYNRNERKEQKILHVYTDRSIYRPGQTVHVSALGFKQLGDNVEALGKASMYIEVRNPDHKVIFKETKDLNELGTIDYEFTLPTNCKLGNYSISINQFEAYSGISIHVEEYKRPTFDVTFDEERNKEKFSLNSQAKIIGQANTFSGVPIQGAKVKYTVLWSKYNNYWRWQQDWQTLLQDETTTLDNGDIIFNIPTDIPEIVYCDSISFRITAEVTDINGEMQRGEYTFNVANPDYQKNEVKNDGPKDEFSSSTDEISESKDAVITFKARERDALVHYCIISNDKVEKHGTKVLNGDELKFTVKYQKEWGDGISVHVFYVRNGHFFSTEKKLVYVRPEKKLTLSWNTFRDKLQPGQKEEWTLSVKDHNNKVVSGAEVLAVMYDASLDNIYPHSWEFDIDFYRWVKPFYLYQSDSNSGMYCTLSPDIQSYSWHIRTYDYMPKFDHQRWYRKPRVMFSSIKGGARFSAKIAAPAVMMEESVTAESRVAMMDNAAGSEDVAPSTVKTLRTNLEEVAFFYPHIMTDAKGEAHIAFTLPDCLTEWKFMGLVHTKDMDYGLITTTATAKKDFMIQPNMPRFLRTGDKAVISAKLMNMCEKEVKGTATLRILNAETEAEVYSAKADFRVPSSQSSALSFPITDQLPEGDYICEIIATNGICNDGERNRLPILTTKEQVVENVPFYLTDAGTKDVDLSAIFNNGSSTATDKQISIGYTDNPAIPVFQSLRALQNPKHDNAPCYAASLYSNLVLLDMSEQLSDYLVDFDKDNTQATADKALKKLKSLQLSDGAWSWFEGMSASYYITLSVAEDLSHLLSYFNSHGKTAPSDIDKMLQKALKYLDKKEYEFYKNRKKHEEILRPYDDDLRYLQIASNPNKEMLNAYLTYMVKDFKNLTIFGRSNGVLILNKYNRPNDAKKFLESVKEYSVFKEGFGRYFATDLAYYSWMDYRIPTQLAAMRAIATENDNENNNKKTLLDMQLWLLRQKQTQTWNNPINALDIADFLLTTNRETSLHKPQTPTLILDGKSVEPDTLYAVDQAKNITITKTSPGVSWGHVRSTFNEEVSNINAYSSGELTIERKVIRDGNKVTIRHIIHADRDMDFVNVMSQHAACLEPLRAVSGYQWLGGRGAYLEVHDSYINIFFDKFTRGTTTVDMEYYIAREGEYNTGYASIECSYAPEFGAHTAGNILDCNK